METEIISVTHGKKFSCSIRGKISILKFSHEWRAVREIIFFSNFSNFSILFQFFDFSSGLKISEKFGGAPPGGDIGQGMKLRYRGEKLDIFR